MEAIATAPVAHHRRSKTPSHSILPARNSIQTRSVANGIDKLAITDLDQQVADDGEAEPLEYDSESLHDAESGGDDDDEDDAPSAACSDDDDDSESSSSLRTPQRPLQMTADGFLHAPYPRVVPAQRPSEATTAAPPGLVMRYRISGSVWKYNAVVNALRAAGLVSTTRTAWANLYWGRHLPGFAYATMIRSWQKLNHFPGTWCLGRKDRLALTLKRARVQYGADEYGFAPLSFVLPAERAGLERAAAQTPNSIWIQKPYSSSCGKGIKLVRRPARIGRRTKCVVSRYVRQPFLIDGYKFDLRLYCLVTCMDPLRIYLNDDGLVRFATERFQLNRTTLSHRRMHLTNYSVNKTSSEFVKPSDATQNATGSKWSLKALTRWFADHNIDPAPVFDRIHDLIIKTIIAAEATVSKRCARLKVGRTNCFELFGIDILLDAKLRPWLLEVNILPSLSSSSPLDKLIKTQLMSDVFHIVGVPIVDGRNPSETATAAADHTRSPQRLNMLNLSAADVAILRETEAEYRRRGNLQRLFPTGARSYSKFFETPRYNNILLERWMALPRQQALRLINMGPESSDSP